MKLCGSLQTQNLFFVYENTLNTRCKSAFATEGLMRTCPSPSRMTEFKNRFFTNGKIKEEHKCDLNLIDETNEETGNKNDTNEKTNQTDELISNFKVEAFSVWKRSICEYCRNFPHFSREIFDHLKIMRQIPSLPILLDNNKSYEEDCLFINKCHQWLAEHKIKYTEFNSIPAIFWSESRTHQKKTFRA